MWFICRCPGEQPSEMSLEEIESRLGSLIQAETISQLKSAAWKERLEGLNYFFLFSTDFSSTGSTSFFDLLSCDLLSLSITCFIYCEWLIRSCYSPSLLILWVLILLVLIDIFFSFLAFMSKQQFLH